MRGLGEERLEERGEGTGWGGVEVTVGQRRRQWRDGNADAAVASMAQGPGSGDATDASAIRVGNLKAVQR